MSSSSKALWVIHSDGTEGIIASSTCQVALDRAIAYLLIGTVVGAIGGALITDVLGAKNTMVKLPRRVVTLYLSCIQLLGLLSQALIGFLMSGLYKVYGGPYLCERTCCLIPFKGSRITLLLSQ
jgi:hypothetical protein